MRILERSEEIKPSSLAKQLCRFNLRGCGGCFNLAPTQKERELSLTAQSLIAHLFFNVYFCFN